MTKKEVNVVVIGGSGYLGKSVFQRLKATQNVNVIGTYYENKPKWASDGEFIYFNGGVDRIDADAEELFSSADVVLNFMRPKRSDFFDSVLFELPLKIANIVTSAGGKFYTFGGRLNKSEIDNTDVKITKRLSNVLKEREIGISIDLTMILDKESRIIDVIKGISKYKITPLSGDGSNKVRAIHIKDFSMIVARLVQAKLDDYHYDLIGRETMTVRHLVSITCENSDLPKPIFFNIKKSLFYRYKFILEGIFEIKLSPLDIQILDYEETCCKKDLCKALKIKPLSFDARVKREGL